MKNNRKARPQPPAASPLYSVGGALALLLLPGVWIATGGLSPRFWTAMLTGFALLAVMGAVVWWAVFRPQTPASLLRAAPPRRQLLAVLTTVCGLLLLGARLWSRPDGADPATLAVTLIAVWTLLAGVALQTSLLPAAVQWNTRRLTGRELHVILQLGVTALLLLPADQPAWVKTPAPGGATPGEAISAWLLPAAVAGVALFVGLTALHGLRRPGAAVMVFAGVLFFRALANFALAQNTGDAALSAVAPLLALVPAAALDAVYVLRPGAARTLLRYALAAGVIIVIGAALLFLPRLPGFPPLTTATGVIVVGTCAVVGSWCGWCGALYGRGLVRAA